MPVNNETQVKKGDTYMADEQNQQTDAPLQSEQEQVKKDPSDNLTPDHPRFKEVIAEKNQLKEEVSSLKEQLEELKEQISTRQQETGNEDLTVEEERALEKIDKQLRNRGYITKDELVVEKRAQEYSRLSDKYNGSNGLPKFDAVEVQAHAKKYGFESLEKAYKDLHFDAFVQLEAKKNGNSINPPSSERAGGGDKQPTKSEFSPEDIASMSDADYEKNREKILSSMKTSVR